jgi:hypothetical protein
MRAVVPADSGRFRPPGTIPTQKCTAQTSMSVGAVSLSVMSITAADFENAAQASEVFASGCADFPVPFLSVTDILTGLEPGVTAAAFLRSLDVAELDDAERVEVLKAWERQQAWTAAHTQAAMLAVAGGEPDEIVDDADDFSREEIALALRLSPRSAGKRLHTARMLAACLPATTAALHTGAISLTHAQILVEECTGLPEAAIRAIETRVIERAPSQTPAQFARSVRRAVLAAAPVSAYLAHTIANTQRGVWLKPEPDAMATLTAFLPAAQARAAYTAIDTAARTTPDRLDPDGRKLGIDERRADALLELLTGRDTARDTGRDTARASSHADIQIVIDAATLLRLADHPAELAGYGPLPAELARQLAADAHWRRLVTDPVTGHLLDYGRTTYRRPAALRDYLHARDRTCRFPGCPQPAPACDIDHQQPWNNNGTTSATNCACLCRRHHRMKTHTNWHLQRHDDASTTWTSPTGHHYHDPPPTQLDSS